MTRLLTFVASCLLALPVGAEPPRLDALAWMAGTWVAESGATRVMETWLGPGNGLMVAANLTTLPDGRKTFEFLRIVEAEGRIAYLASPGGREPVEFPLKESGARRVVFENSARDFPRRILYWRDGESLFAQVEGSRNGRDLSEEWRFERAQRDGP